MRIITISREFGSGGRELGKRLADVLLECYRPFNIFVCAETQATTDWNIKELTPAVAEFINRWFGRNS